MKKTWILPSLLFPITLAIGACSGGGTSEGSATGGNSSSSGGSPSSGGTSGGRGGATSSGGVSGSGGVTSSGGVGITGGTMGSGGATGSGGASATGGATSNGGVTSGTGGGSSRGGATGTGGATSNGGARTGGATGTGGTTTIGGATGTGGATASGGATGAGGATPNGGSTGTSVTVSPTCKIPAWPSPTGSTVNISGTKSVTNYDGGGALHEGDGKDCTVGDQDSTSAIIEVANGGSVKNVIFGKKIGDGIHCLGSCTIDNVWFQYICDDAITINVDSAASVSATSTIKNSGFKYARDKTIQHNGGDSTLNIDNVYVETAGKLYRSCGEGGGCTSSAKHTVNISNVVAIGVGQVAGVSENDHATLTNICAFRSPILCSTYKVGSDSDSTTGANGTNEGPSPSCTYKGSDTHALVDRVGGVTLTTDVLCPGSSSVKTGDSATACITSFDKCLKVCAPGMYGFKEVSCSGGKYTGPDIGGCALVTSAADSAAATNLAGSRAATASSTVTKNNSCTTQWALGIDSSKSTNTCECVMKPGYYGQSSGYAPPVSWMAWDCQAQWW
jgi:pectate lyase